MMFWLRNADVDGNTRRLDGGPSIGVDGDILRREAFATFLDLDAAYTEARRQRDAMLEEARNEAASILEQAQAQADALVAEAQQERLSGFARGEEEGLRQAAADWHARSAQHFRDEHALLARMRERFAELIAGALERLAGTIDRGALFAQAAHEMDRLVAADSALTVRVHPSDLAVARREFEACAAQWLERGRPVTLSVVAERSLAPGACVCESDLGTLDASLATQLDAMRAALSGVLRDMPVQWAPSETDSFANEDEWYDEEMSDDDPDDLDEQYDRRLPHDETDSLNETSGLGDDDESCVDEDAESAAAASATATAETER